MNFINYIMIAVLAVALVVYMIVRKRREARENDDGAKRPGANGKNGNGANGAGTSGAGENGADGSEPGSGGRGRLLALNSKAVASFGDGIVYDTRNKVLGRYDADGRVYSRDRSCIGRSEGDSAVMDRSYLPEELKREPGTSGLRNPKYRPAMTLEAAVNRDGCITSPAGEQLALLDRPGGPDPTGENAAFLLAVHSGVIGGLLPAFYSGTKLLTECDYIKKHGRGDDYAQYFRETYGRPLRED